MIRASIPLRTFLFAMAVPVLAGCSAALSPAPGPAAPRVAAVADPALDPDIIRILSAAGDDAVAAAQVSSTTDIVQPSAVPGVTPQPVAEVITSSLSEPTGSTIEIVGASWGETVDPEATISPVIINTGDFAGATQPMTPDLTLLPQGPSVLPPIPVTTTTTLLTGPEAAPAAAAHKPISPPIPSPYPSFRASPSIPPVTASPAGGNRTHF